MERLVRYAPFLADLIDVVRVAMKGSFTLPGVLEYEVCNPFGNWVGKHIVNTSEMPSETECKKWLAREIIAFFNQAENNQNTNVIADAVNQALTTSISIRTLTNIEGNHAVSCADLCKHAKRSAFAFGEPGPPADVSLAKQICAERNTFIENGKLHPAEVLI